MIKGNSYILVFTVLVSLIIILVSTTPIIIKTLLTVMAIAFLFPIIRRTLFKNNLRKIKVAFYSSLSFTIGICLFSFLFSEEQSFYLDGDLIGSITVILFLVWLEISVMVYQSH
ncbi:hypothetical protein ACWF7H_22520 [Peribacillus butanolivorans]|uniref:hypothetical protein n=1 Tax=Peribacillus butanolivorans TaxID=421767 RepID=UPI003692212C